jgi:glycogen debranching enzyme
VLIGAVILKEDDVQFVTNATGDVPSQSSDGLGLYYRDTRFLSGFDLTVNGQRPVFLSNTNTKHYIATFQAINPPYRSKSGPDVGPQTVSIRRSRFVTGKGLYERIGFMNCNHFPIDLEAELALDVDFKDMFAVRGFKDQASPAGATIRRETRALHYSRVGRDGVRRGTRISFSRAPDALSDHQVRFCFHLPPRQWESVVVRVQPEVGDDVQSMSPDFDGELEALAASYRDWERLSTRFETDNEFFDQELLRASRNDIRTLLEWTDHGAVPDAGVPWYSVPFGRDAIITALQTLTYNPGIAEGTLRFLAAHQGTTVDPYREEEPGKILHELRRGELAHLGEVPHTPYYGTVDATPLFVVLFIEAMRWLDSEDLYRDILPASLRAVEWIDRYGDVDGDGYVEYIAHHGGGVINQGWKDSAESVQYDDGRMAVPPIALVEVQGYVYQAKIGLASLLRDRGDGELASRLEREARDLKERFNRDFWLEDEQFYALALDRDKRPVRSITSNAGHCLWAGICDDEKAHAVAERLIQPDMFSGWGIRTLSADSPNYNPMSYHNGSVWPHDNAIIALGLRRASKPELAARLVQAMLEAGFRFPGARLPELFCGFPRDRRFNSSPAAYAVSCSPQAWAAGSVFMFLQSVLDLRPDVRSLTLQSDPILPRLFRRVSLQNVRLGEERVDLSVSGEGLDVSVSERLAVSAGT